MHSSRFSSSSKLHCDCELRQVNKSACLAQSRTLNVIHFGCRQKPILAVHQPARDPTHRPGEEGLQPSGDYSEERCGSGPGCRQQPHLLVWSLSPENLQVSQEKQTLFRAASCELIWFNYRSKAWSQIKNCKKKFFCQLCLIVCNLEA